MGGGGCSLLRQKLLHLSLSLLVLLGPLLPALLTPLLLPAPVTAMSLFEPFGHPWPGSPEPARTAKAGSAEAKSAASPGAETATENQSLLAADRGTERGPSPGTPTVNTENPAPASPHPAPLWVEVDLARQRVRVWKEGALLREMVASTGLPESPTPTGVFRLENRGRFFFSKKYGQGGWWWVSFLNRGEYLFHSVPTDEKGRIIPEEAEKLGRPASHGCVRLSLEDAQWFYDQMPEGTPVVIR